jgi:hypothetical protein
MLNRESFRPSPHWDNLWSPGVDNVLSRTGYRTEKLFLSDNLVIPSLLIKQGDKIIWMREEKEKRYERTVH